MLNVDHALDLTACDLEPIHIPGAIQPHGLLLVADMTDGTIVAGAGEIEARLADPFLGQTLDEVLGDTAAAQLMSRLADGAAPTHDSLVAISGRVPGRDEMFSAVAHRRNDHILIELEPASEPGDALQTLAELERLARRLEAAPQLNSLYDRGAVAFHEITGFDRVMIYRFLDDDTGRVVAEARSDGMESFLNHHFPAGDIPRQARALYLRSLSRVIPDVGYTPAPLRPAHLADLDLSDVGLRSVSPIHLQYLRHMQIGASASFSIICDGRLWGLVACHHREPRLLPRETMLRAGALAGTFARQIRAREHAQEYDERLRIRDAVDELAGHFFEEENDQAIFSSIGETVCHTLNAHGFVHIRAGKAAAFGVTPTGAALDDLVAWAFEQTAIDPSLQTDALSELYPKAAQWPERAAGLLFLRMPQPGHALMWTRVERREEVVWAGNPHDVVKTMDAAVLTPRASFATWVESVAGHAAPWTREEIVGARHFLSRLVKAQDERNALRLARDLRQTLDERDALLRQKDLLMREIDHRMLNSLQMVGAYLSLQAREEGPGTVADHLNQAQTRLSAIGLVHRQLFRRDNDDHIDLRVYLGDLLRDLVTALGPEWERQLATTLAPILITGDRAMQVGIVLVELTINATKYAYDGLPGPIAVSLVRQGSHLRLSVNDEGQGRKLAAGKASKGTGFGSKMIRSTVAQLGGTLAEDERSGGLSVTMVAPIEAA